MKLRKPLALAMTVMAFACALPPVEDEPPDVAIDRILDNLQAELAQSDEVVGRARARGRALTRLSRLATARPDIRAEIRAARNALVRDPAFVAEARAATQRLVETTTPLEPSADDLATAHAWRAAQEEAAR